MNPLWMRGKLPTIHVYDIVVAANQEYMGDDGIRRCGVARSAVWRAGLQPFGDAIDWIIRVTRASTPRRYRYSLIEREACEDRLVGLGIGLVIQDVHSTISDLQKIHVAGDDTRLVAVAWCKLDAILLLDLLDVGFREPDRHFHGEPHAVVCKHEYAEDCRRLAKSMKAEHQCILLKIADAWERVAEEASAKVR